MGMGGWVSGEQWSERRNNCHRTTINKKKRVYIIYNLKSSDKKEIDDRIK